MCRRQTNPIQSHTDGVQTGVGRVEGEDAGQGLLVVYGQDREDNSEVVQQKLGPLSVLRKDHLSW